MSDGKISGGEFRKEKPTIQQFSHTNPYMQKQILSQIPLIQCLASEIAWDVILNLFTPKIYHMGEILFRVGDVPDSINFVMRGKFIYQCEGNDTDLKTTQTAVKGSNIGVYLAFHNLPSKHLVVSSMYRSVILSMKKSKFFSVLKIISNIALEKVKSYVNEYISSEMSVDKRKSEDSHKKKKKDSDEFVSERTTWRSLQQKKPIEYEINSALLILHEDNQESHPITKKASKIADICVKAKENAVKRNRTFITLSKYDLRNNRSPEIRSKLHNFTGPADIPKVMCKLEKNVSRLLKPREKNFWQINNRDLKDSSKMNFISSRRKNKYRSFDEIPDTESVEFNNQKEDVKVDLKIERPVIQLNINRETAIQLLPKI